MKPAFSGEAHKCLPRFTASRNKTLKRKGKLCTGTDKYKIVSWDLIESAQILAIIQPRYKRFKTKQEIFLVLSSENHCVMCGL